MTRLVLRLAALPALCIALAATAASAQAITVSLGQPDLSARVAITVPVTVSCTPFDASRTHYASTISVSAEQAAGKGIATASGMAYGPLPNLLFPCDSMPHTVPVVALASSSGPPFHGGPAVFSASASADAGTPCTPDSTTCFFDIVSQAGAAGPTTFNVH